MDRRVSTHEGQGVVYRDETAAHFDRFLLQASSLVDRTPAATRPPSPISRLGPVAEIAVDRLLGAESERPDPVRRADQAALFSPKNLKTGARPAIAVGFVPSTWTIDDPG